VSADTRDLSGTPSPLPFSGARSRSPAGILIAETDAVARPRRIIRGDTYLITRRCAQRAFRLVPGDTINRIFMYCLAFAMQKTGVRLHAVCVMSNHHHLVVSDPRGLLPDFLRELHRLTAKAINTLQGQMESLWANQPCSGIRLDTDDDVDDKIAYVMVNPVAAGLVHDPGAWPGAHAWGNVEIVVARPTAYFSDAGSCPAELTLVVEPPPTRNGDALARSTRIARLRRIIAEAAIVARESIRKGGRHFLGVAGVRAASFAEKARSYEPPVGSVPAFAARMKDVRDRLREIEQDFQSSYRRALELWRRGRREVAFPVGTWWMAVFHAASVEPPLHE
jgi:putative transposase